MSFLEGLALLAVMAAIFSIFVIIKAIWTNKVIQEIRSRRINTKDNGEKPEGSKKGKGGG